MDLSQQDMLLIIGEQSVTIRVLEEQARALAARVKELEEANEQVVQDS